MMSYIEILSTPTSDTPGTVVVLHYDSKRYVIGQIGEGTQRICAHEGFSLNLLKTVAFFATGRTEWRSIGGLLGMILTMADAQAGATEALRLKWRQKVEGLETRLEHVVSDGQRQDLERALARARGNRPQNSKSDVAVWGARGLVHALAAARRFVFRTGLPLYPHEVGREEKAAGECGEVPISWQDENVRVWAMAIAPEEPDEDVVMSNPQSVAGRKRSIDEANGQAVEAGTGDDNGKTAAAQEKENDAICTGIVAEMFRSSWRLDQLIEQPISTVHQPAAMFIKSPETKHLEEYTGPLPGKEGFKDIKVWVRQPWPGALVTRLPSAKPSKEAASYIFLSHPQRGRFDGELLAKFGLVKGVPGVGKMMSALTDGKSVEFNDTTITPDMVKGPSEPGRGVAVIDLPSREYVQPLLQRPEWKSPDVVNGLTFILWILGDGVALDPALRSFMQERSHIEHAISAPEYCADNLSMSSVAKTAARMNRIDPDRYPIPRSGPASRSFRDDFPSTAEAGGSTIKTHLAIRGLRLETSPEVKVVTDAVKEPLFLDTDGSATDPNLQISDEAMAIVEQARQAKQAAVQDSEGLTKWRSSLPCPDAEVITLGTGSALPSKYRNVSATLLRVPGGGSYLLDAGENTLGQLRRMYEPAELVEVLKDLRMIWISHLHADHHLGIVSVIKAWHEATRSGDSFECPPRIAGEQLTTQDLLTGSRRLAVVSDTGMLNFLVEYSHVENYGYPHILPLYISDAVLLPDDSISPSHLFHQPTITTSNPLPTTPSGTPHPNLLPPSTYAPLLGLSDIQSVHVNHCHGAKAVSLTFPNGFKASYSGDCRPSMPFSRIGEGSTLLVHEATFDDDLVAEARAKQHCTTREALDVGRLMGASALLLTHFSQRYRAPPVAGLAKAAAGGAEAPASAGEMRVGVAFDYMRVRVGDIGA